MEERASEGKLSSLGAAWTAVLGLISFVGVTAAAFAVLWGAAREWYGKHGGLGWGLLIGCAFAGVAIAVYTRHRFVVLAFEWNAALKDAADERAAAETLREKERLAPQRAAESKADIDLVERLLGPFLKGGELRGDLEELHDKYFSRPMASVFEGMDEYFTTGHERIYDEKLREALDGVHTALNAYWPTFRDLLDAHPHIENRRWNLQILQPPGGGWEGETMSERWDDFYAFVRSLSPLRLGFIGSLRPLETRLYQLRVETGSAQTEPSSPAEG